MGEVFFVEKTTISPLTSTAFALENDYNVPSDENTGGGKKPGKMVYRVYIDVIFAVNLFMDLAVLAMLNRLFSYRADLKHMIRGAVLGAVWACVLAVFPETPLLLQMFGTYVAVGSLMAVTAYGIRSRKELIRAVGGIYLISVVLGGVMLALSESSLGREVANWMPGRFSIRFFLAAGAFVSASG